LHFLKKFFFPLSQEKAADLSPSALKHSVHSLLLAMGPLPALTNESLCQQHANFSHLQKSSMKGKKKGRRKKKSTTQGYREV
jgi:hypothetical protein